MQRVGDEEKRVTERWKLMGDEVMPISSQFPSKREPQPMTVVIGRRLEIGERVEVIPATAADELVEAIERHRSSPYRPGDPSTVGPALAHLAMRDDELYAALNHYREDSP